jgi:acyl-coenzyme A synthetase/AMP-(fatty) acid ligase
VEKIQKAAPGCGVFNHYGPTETTVGVLTNRVLAEERVNGAANVPLGRPIPNTQIYVLDSRRQPVAPGMAGEIYVGGDSVARGYLNQRALTEERFVSDPFSGRPNGRLYRTGDRARLLPDGKLEFLGRVDHQLKIRGYRIELGEIEVALTRYDGIREAVAVARDTGDGEKQLVAYFVASAPEISVADLRRFLKTQLPDYMVPMALVQLEKLPLTANGKVDRQALPSPESERRSAEAQYVAPRTESEQAVERIWAEVLRLERIGVNDDFFELGGHSLLAARIATRVREMFQIDFTLGHFLRAPTIAQSAAAIEAELVAEVSRLSDEEAQKLTQSPN